MGKRKRVTGKKQAEISAEVQTIVDRFFASLDGPPRPLSSVPTSSCSSELDLATQILIDPGWAEDHGLPRTQEEWQRAHEEWLKRSAEEAPHTDEEWEEWLKALAAGISPEAG